MTARQWSAPYYGVQHLAGLKKEFQITVTDRGSFAECDVFMPGQYGPKSAVTETQHATAAAARTHGEAQAAALGVFA